MTRVLITGGAGFVGSHLADRLLAEGYQVRVLDNLSPQVHGARTQAPEYLDPRVQLILGDVRDRALVAEALDGVEAVFHLAAAVGVGQSMYQVETYTDINNRGTAILLETLAQLPPGRRAIRRLVVASSMSLYGEGLYRNTSGMLCAPPGRTPEMLRAGDWELRDVAGLPLDPLPTPETKIPDPASIYALSKFDQERMCLILGQAYGIPATALRFFNIYGPRQALSNPYTGVLAIFSARYLNDRPPQIFEDGRQRRDFVHVRDVARACQLALERDEAIGQVFNVASGRACTVLEVAEQLGRILKKSHIAPEVTGKFRLGDVRHCYADIDKARKLLGYEPQVSLEDGLAELADWLKDQQAEDRTEFMQRELASRGLGL